MLIKIIGKKKKKRRRILKEEEIVVWLIILFSVIVPVHILLFHINYRVGLILEGSDWTSVEETMPDRMSRVIVYNKAINDWEEFLYTWNGWERASDLGFGYPVEITHWMYVPDLPKEGKE